MNVRAAWRKVSPRSVMPLRPGCSFAAAELDEVPQPHGFDRRVVQIESGGG